MPPSSHRAARQAADGVRGAAARLSHIVRSRSEERRVVCILGMHRSGTSALAGTLRVSGLYLGNVSSRHPNNARGNQEHVPIRLLNDSILAHSGGSWREPPDNVSWTDDHVKRREAIIDWFAPVRVWGFKDPRTLLVFDFWREGIAGMSLVGTFRHPLAVRDSLVARDGGVPEEWLNLWLRYNQRLVALHEEQPFPLLDFDLDADGYARAAVVAVAQLGFKSRSTFFDRRLRHRECRATDNLPSPVAQLYGELCERAMRPGQTAASLRMT